VFEEKMIQQLPLILTSAIASRTNTVTRFSDFELAIKKSCATARSTLKESHIFFLYTFFYVYSDGHIVLILSLQHAQ